MGVNKVVFGAVSIMDISDSTVTPDKLAKGATAYDKSGEKITGTMEAATDPVLQEKTVTPKTSAQSVTPDSGYDGLSKVTVNAMPTATQATPSISVNSSGLITASATQTAGYVAAGTKSATKQLTTQAATTYTPGTSNQTIAAGTYCSGAQTIKGDANLVAGNIKSGVSIFGVAGTHEGGVTPTGTLEITENGTYDVTQYASASVNVASSGGGSVETCTVTLVGEAPPEASRIVYYANGSATPQSVTFPSLMDGTMKISAVKNSIIYLVGTYVASGNITRLYIGTYFVTGDATISSN